MSTDTPQAGSVEQAAAVILENEAPDIQTEVKEQRDLQRLLEKVLDRTIEVHDDGPNANLFDTRKFNQCYRVATAMADMSILPDHLKRDKSGPYSQRQIIANCFRIVNQAVRWGFDPYAIVDETYVVGGKLGYQGKLVAAVVNARAGLVGRLRFTHEGTGDAMTVTVAGKFKDDPDNVCEIKLSVKDAKTDNQMWKKDPEQKLCYSGAIKWARRYCPEVVLGVLTDDDVDKIQLDGESISSVGDLTQLTDTVKARTAEYADKPKDDLPRGNDLFPKGNPDASEV